MATRAVGTGAEVTRTPWHRWGVRRSPFRSRPRTVFRVQFLTRTEWPAPAKGRYKKFFLGTKLPISFKTNDRGETNPGTKLPFRCRSVGRADLSPATEAPKSNERPGISGAQLQAKPRCILGSTDAKLRSHLQGGWPIVGFRVDHGDSAAGATDRRNLWVGAVFVMAGADPTRHAGPCRGLHRKGAYRRHRHGAYGHEQDAHHGLEYARQTACLDPLFPFTWIWLSIPAGTAVQLCG